VNILAIALMIVSGKMSALSNLYTELKLVKSSQPLSFL